MAFAKRECRLNADDQTKQLANDLSTQFGRGFGVVNLSQMRRFFLEWPTKGILQTPSEKSSTPIFINDGEEVNVATAIAGLSLQGQPSAEALPVLSVLSVELHPQGKE